MTNTDATDATNVALAISPSQFLDDETNPPVTVQSVDCPNGTKMTSLPVGTPPGPSPASGPPSARTAVRLRSARRSCPADGAYVSLRGWQSTNGTVAHPDRVG